MRRDRLIGIAIIAVVCIVFWTTVAVILHRAFA